MLSDSYFLLYSIVLLLMKHGVSYNVIYICQEMVKEA